MGNLMLAAHALGLGSCWVHRAREVLPEQRGRHCCASGASRASMPAWPCL
ncbi:MAG: nitroreductase family protein [Evtepia gabavorous]